MILKNIQISVNEMNKSWLSLSLSRVSHKCFMKIKQVKNFELLKDSRNWVKHTLNCVNVTLQTVGRYQFFLSFWPYILFATALSAKVPWISLFLGLSASHGQSTQSILICVLRNWFGFLWNWREILRNCFGCLICVFGDKLKVISLHCETTQIHKSHFKN